IGHGDRGLKVQCPLEGFLTLGGDGHVVSPAGQNRGETFARIFLVVRHQYPVFHGSPPPRVLPRRDALGSRTLSTALVEPASRAASAVPRSHHLRICRLTRSWRSACLTRGIFTQ